MTSVNVRVGDCVCVFVCFFFFFCALLLSSSSSLCGRAVVQIQQLSDQSFSELRPAVAFNRVGVRHLVEDVRVIDGDADAQPEHLLPGLVGLVENKVPVGGKKKEASYT